MICVKVTSMYIYYIRNLLLQLTQEKIVKKMKKYVDNKKVMC